VGPGYGIAVAWVELVCEGQHEDVQHASCADLKVCPRCTPVKLV
jgi:hypothetical protein